MEHLEAAVSEYLRKLFLKTLRRLSTRFLRALHQLHSEAAT